MDAQTDERSDRHRLVGLLRDQAQAAAGLGSPLYADLLGHAADDVAAGGPCWTVLSMYAHQPGSAALPLRFMAAVHRLVLRRQAPALALHYASVGGQAPVEGAWAPFRDTVEQHVEELQALTSLPCQTNEVGRSAALAPAMLALQARHDLPLVHLEIGTSAGLNLRWDHFRYGTADGSVSWGDPGSPVDLTGHWRRVPEGLPSTAEVTVRRGCDPAPGDPADADTREGLTASVWADQHLRHQRLRGALQLAARVPVEITAAGAGSWLAQQLPERPDGLTLVTHSVVWRYIDADERLQIQQLLADHGEQATRARPLVWMRLEPRPPMMTYDGTPYPVMATTWPGGRTEVLAQAQAHGQEVVWEATAKA